MKKNKKYLFITIILLGLLIVSYKIGTLNNFSNNNKEQFFDSLLALPTTTTKKTTTKATTTTTKTTTASLIDCQCSVCNTVAAECATCNTTVCSGGYEDKNCSSCKTGSPGGACVGGYVPTSTCLTYNTCVATGCGCKTYGTKYSACATGSNTCVGADEEIGCEILGAEQYTSGNGGSNYYSSSVPNPVSFSGVQTGNGKIIIEFIGE